MRKNKSLQHLLELNFAIIFISTSGALGRYIDLPVPVIICSRAILGGAFIFLFCKWKGLSFKVNSADRWTFFFSGLLLGAHWITYFYALKLSNVAIGMISLFTYPIITTFLEPLLLKTKFKKVHLLLALLVVVGIYFLIPDLDFENDYSKALALGILSAFLYSLRNIITKSKINAYNGSVLMFYQLLVIAFALSPSFLLQDTSSLPAQLSAVIILSLLTTAIGHTWFIYSFKNFSVTTSSIISSLQPVYGILIGILFLKEFPPLSTIIGGLLIVSSVVIESIISFKKPVG